jgi:hypothetical protein
MHLRSRSHPPSPGTCIALSEVPMADDLHNRGNQDRSRVNVNEKWEIDYWTKKWGVTREQLVAAAKEVGVSVAAIAKKLGKK